MTRLSIVLLLCLAAAAPAVEYSLQASGIGAGSGSGSGVYTSQVMIGQVAGIEVSAGSYRLASGYIAQVRKAGYVNAQPTLDPIDDQTVLEDSGITTVSLSGIGDGSSEEIQDLSVTAVSSNQALILDPTITYTSPDSTGILSFAPVTNTYGSATITVTVKDSGGTLNGASDTIQRSFVITVTAVNDAPTLAQPADLTISEDASQQTVALTGIGSGASNESQTLVVSAYSSDTSKIPNPSVSYTSANGTGSLSFTPVVDAFGLVNIFVVVQDSGGTANGGVDSFSRVFSVDIAASNDPPALVTNVGLTLEATKSGIISFDLLRTIDDDPPGQLVYTVPTVPVDGELRLNGVALADNGSFTQADINAGVVSYKHTGTTAGSDSFDFFVSDPYNLTTLLATFNITITATSGATNEVPVVTLPSGVQTWIEGDGPRLIDSAGTVADADGTLAGGTLTISIIDNAEAGDRLAIRHIGTGSSDIGVSGSIVTYGGATLGSFSGGSGSTPLSITLSASATPTKVQALVRALTYTHLSAAPSEADRLIQVLLDDGAGGTSSPVVATLQVQGVNSAPTVTFAQTTLAYVENDGAVVIDTGTTISDADSSNLDGGAVVLRIASGGGPDDVLGIQHQGGASGQISLVGTSVGYEGTVIGSVSGGSSGTPLSVTLNASAVPSSVQALLRALTFANGSDAFATTLRQLELTVSDGDGGTSSAANLPVSMTATNDPPVLAIPTTSFGYTEGDGPVAIAAGASVSDVDSPSFDTGIVQVSMTSGATAEDWIDIANIGTAAGQISVSGGTISYSNTPIGTYGGPVNGSTTLLVALNAQADAAGVQAMIQALRFENASAAPTTGTRSVRLSITDGAGGSSDPRTVAINVDDENSAPQLLLSGATPTYVENADPVLIDGAITITDADSANLDGGALIVALAAGAAPEDVLAIRHTGFAADQVGVTGSDVYYSGSVIGSIDSSIANTLIVNLNFRSTPTKVSAVASAFTFATISEDPSTTSRSIQFVVTDGDGDASATQTVSLSVQAVNDAPTASNSNLATMVGVELGFTLPGSDPEGDAMTFSLINPQPANGSVVTLDDAATGAITFTPGAVGSDSFTYQIFDGVDTSPPITVSTYVTGLDEPRPHVISSPPMSVVAGDGLVYQVQVDVSQLGGNPNLTFVLVGDVPAGMTITETGNTSATVDWTATGSSGTHQEFGILFMDPAANRAGYQPVQFILQAPAFKLMGNG